MWELHFFFLICISFSFLFFSHVLLLIIYKTFLLYLTAIANDSTSTSDIPIHILQYIGLVLLGLTTPIFDTRMKWRVMI